MSLHRENAVRRVTVGKVRDQFITACFDDNSLWVEVAGPKGGNAREYAPKVARELASLLNAAANVAENDR